MLVRPHLSGHLQDFLSVPYCVPVSSVSQTFFSKPPGGLYSLPYLSEGPPAEPVALSRAEWWEVLFFIKKLEPKQQQEVNSLLQQTLGDQVRAQHSGACWEAKALAQTRRASPSVL